MVSLSLLQMWTPFVKPLQRVVPSWTLISTTRVSKLRSTAFSNLCPPVLSSANSFQILQLAACLLLLPVCCCLTNTALSDIPSFCGALNFLDSQLLFDAAFPSFPANLSSHCSLLSLPLLLLLMATTPKPTPFSNACLNAAC
jgi:hypothetical protein